MSGARTVHSVMSSQSLRLRPCNLPAVLAVGLVAHEGEDEEGVAAVVAGVLHPLGNAVKAASICQVEANQAAVRVPVVPIEGGGVEGANECGSRERKSYACPTPFSPPT